MKAPPPSPKPPRGAALRPPDEQRLALQHALFERARPWLPRDPFPHYLAHLRLVAGDRTFDVLFIADTATDRASPDTDLLIAHYQTSAFASILFGYAEGEGYELATASGIASGLVLERNLVSFRDGELAELITGDQRLCRGTDGPFRRLERLRIQLQPRSAELQERPPSLIDVSLDPTQRSVVDLPEQVSVLVLGEAGHGKTTVALHRLARLVEAAPSSRAVVIVPTDGLRRLLQPLLVSLGADVEVEIYEHWARRQARASFAHLPDRESADATAGVIRFKRDPAVRAGLLALATGKAESRSSRNRSTSRALRTRRSDLLHLFGDRALVAQITAASQQTFGPHVIAELLEHTHVQFSRTSEEAHAHVDRARLRAVDGRPLDEGTPWQDAGSIDAEDYAILFELDRLRAEQLQREPLKPPQYDHILVDEAQEFAPLELRLIGRSLGPEGSVIVAGDADQQTDPAASFGSWEGSMEELGRAPYERVVLPVSYRCPPAVVDIAQRLLPSRGAKPANSAKHSSREPASKTEDSAQPPLQFLNFLNDCHLGAWLTEVLRVLRTEDPSASVAVICRLPQTARRVHGMLRHAGLGRLVTDGEFLFRSGVNVTHLDEVKGLEFDYVIVPDASAATYPNTPEARRALYVAVTRARHQLVLGAVAGQTPLLEFPGVAP